MKVKQRFTKLSLRYLVGLICVTLFALYYINKGHTLNLHLIDEPIILCFFMALGIIMVFYSLYCIIYYSMALSINNFGITRVWFGIFKHSIKWSDFTIVQVATLRSFSWVDLKIETIVCSRIPIKYCSDPDGSLNNVINMEWALHKPNTVVTIFIDDLKSGQLEEFWSYVPERLKT